MTEEILIASVVVVLLVLGLTLGLLMARARLVPKSAVTVTVNGTRQIEAARSDRLLGVLHGAGIGIPAACGGSGTCGLCRVRVSGDRHVNDGMALRDWAVAGAGVALKSSFDVAADIAAGRLEPVLEGFTREATNLYAVSPPRAYEARRVRLFLDHLGAGLAG